MTRWSRDRMLCALLEAPRRGLQPLPDSSVVERPGWWRLTTPSFRDGGFNEVALSILGEDEVDQVIAETLADYARLGLSFRWLVGPDSAPSDLAVRLERAGLVAHPVWAMGAEIENVVIAPPPACLQVERVSVDREPAFTRVMTEGWSTDPDALARYHQQIAGDARARMRLFLATVESEPAGAASYVAIDDVAFLMGAVVLPRFRGMGVYRALVRARLADATGCTLAGTHAGSQSAPILSRLGFDAVCELAMFMPP